MISHGLPTKIHHFAVLDIILMGRSGSSINKTNHHNITKICDVKVFLTFTFTEYGTVLTTILPILFLYLNTVIVTAGAFEP